MDNQTITIRKDKTCVYQHLVDGVIVYVGMGNYNRPLSMRGRSKEWHDTVNSGVFEVVIVKWFDDRQAASVYERKMIIDLSPMINIQYLKECGADDHSGMNKIKPLIAWLKSCDDQTAADQFIAEGTSIGYVRQIAYGNKNPSGQKSAAIERVTGISRREMRPHDWHKVWPELAEKS